MVSLFLALLGCFTVPENEQLLVKTMTGRSSVINGPTITWVPPCLKSVERQEAFTLGPLEYVKVKNSLSGDLRIEEGPKLLFLNPYDEIESRATAISLKANEYVRFVDDRTGELRVVLGPLGRVVPGVFERVLDPGIEQAIDLKCFEYVKLEDKQTGKIRVEQGEKLVFPTEYEGVIGSVQQAVEIDSETAALVRNKRSGQQHLVTEKKLFIPNRDEEILEVRKLIKLAVFEACVVRGQEGEFKFYFGSNDLERRFFLPPHSDLVELRWSRGRRREKKDLSIVKVDLRPKYMSFEFNCRTADNVELILEGCFFWEISDMSLMIKSTTDTTGDICSHARSRFIEKVSKVTLQQFMNDINSISSAVHQQDTGDQSFYTKRGVKIHSLEVTAYRCAEQSTAQILEQIIQETTNRMNRMSKQESENEVQLQQIKGDMQEEKARRELLKLQSENTEARAAMEGVAEAARVTSFLQHLSSDVPTLDKRVEVWNMLRKKDTLAAVAGSKTHLFYTPNDVNLSIRDTAL